MNWQVLWEKYYPLIGDFVINFQNNTNYSHQEFDGVSLEIENKIDKKTFTFTINKGNKKFTKDLRPFMENMLKNNSSGKPFNVEFISTDFNLENYRFKIYFNDLSEDNFQNRKNINTSGGIIFITKIKFTFCFLKMYYTFNNI